MPVRFAISGDADATPGTNGKPAFNGFEVYARMAAERNDFNVNLGDTIYSDSEVAGAPPALTVPAKWGKYKLGLALAPLRTLRASTGLYSHWDDHEFVNDFSPRRARERDLRARASKAFRDYAPVADARHDGLYRTFRWGKNLELFFLDERSFRSREGVATACGGDLAPTAPAAVRDGVRRARARRSRSPVPQACLDGDQRPRAHDARRAPARRASRKAITASTATWKVIVNEVPIDAALRAARTTAGRATRPSGSGCSTSCAGVKNVVVLTTDTHANLVGEVRHDARSTRRAPTRAASGRSSPARSRRTRTRRRSTPCSARRAPATSSTSLFFKPPPPSGLGLRCAALDTYSYAQVTVTRDDADRDAEGGHRRPRAARRPAPPAHRSSSGRADPAARLVP